MSTSPHQLLPPEAQEILRRAAATPVSTENPLARTKALEKANRRIRELFPKHFTHEKE